VRSNAEVCAELSILHSHAVPHRRDGGRVNLFSMPVDLFPNIDMPVVVVATFYNGMPPQQIEADITNTFERFFTLAANVDHSESRSLTGVSLIKIYFKPGTDPNAALSNVSNLAMADSAPSAAGHAAAPWCWAHASTQPVCLVTLEGQGAERNAAEGSGAVPGAQPDLQRPGRFGSAALWRNLSPDPGLRRSAQDGGAQPEPERRGHRGDSSNLILPAGDVRIGNKDFNIYANSQFPTAAAMNQMPLKSVGNGSVLVADIGTPSTPALCSTTSCASMASARSTFRSSNRAATATPSPS
jgi:hypothetical protein